MVALPVSFLETSVQPVSSSLPVLPSGGQHRATVFPNRSLNDFVDDDPSDGYLEGLDPGDEPFNHRDREGEWQGDEEECGLLRVRKDLSGLFRLLFGSSQRD